MLLPHLLHNWKCIFLLSCSENYAPDRIYFIYYRYLLTARMHYYFQNIDLQNLWVMESIPNEKPCTN